MTIEGMTVIDAFEKTLEYFKRQGYRVVDEKEPHLAFTKKDVRVDGGVAELWLSISVLGEHYVTIFMDYQLRPESAVAPISQGYILTKIEEEYEGLWRTLRQQARA